MSKTTARRLMKRIEEFLNAEIPGTPRIGGRVHYVALPVAGTEAELSPRAEQVMKFLRRRQRATSAALQSALRVNRNVIAGAVHELKQAGLLKSESIDGFSGGRHMEVAHEAPPRRRKTIRKK
jgi:DNA segregation ATPase FtsK/SpoIIIE-like protein